MAIHLDHPGLAVHVTVNGQPLSEYEDIIVKRKPKVTTRYIEASAGSQFKIRYTFTKTSSLGRDVYVDCYVDGSLIRTPVHRQEKLEGFYVVRGLKELQENRCTRRDLCFNSLIVGMIVEHVRLLILIQYIRTIGR